MAQKATYIDEAGNKQTGVYNTRQAMPLNQTEEATGVYNTRQATPLNQTGVYNTRQAIPLVQDQGNSGLGASQPASGTHWDQMRNLYQQQYNEQEAANNAAYEAAAARAREVTQQNIDTLNQGYQGTNRQLYRDYMEHQRALPQQMAARGMSGGASESSMLRLRNSYEEGLNENERARLAQISSAEGDLAQKLFEAQATATAANQQARQQQLGYLTALQEQEYQDLKNRADTMASAGDFSGYRELGYSDADIKTLQDMWARSNPALAYSKGLISAETYYQLTGSYPPGYSTGSSGGGGGSGGSNRNGDTGATDWSKLGYSDQDVINAMANGYSVYNSPLSYANAMKRAANNLAAK